MITKVEKIRIIENNLFELYQKFTSFKSFETFNGNWYKSIYSQQIEWPNFVFDINTKPSKWEDEISKLAQDINEKKKPPFLIFSDKNIDEGFIHELRLNKFLPVMRWPGMLLDLSKFNMENKLGNGVFIKEVTTISDFKIWIDIVNTTLFKTKGLKLDVIQDLLLQEEVNILLAFYRDIPCGTLMTYSNEKSKGVYLVSTLPEFRSKGCMNSLMVYAINYAKKEKLNYMVLEANDASFNIYKKLGFEQICNFDIFWKPK